MKRYAFPMSMALLMTYGMELYNHALMGMPFGIELLLSPLSELIPIACAVLIVEKLAGGRLVAWIQDLLEKHNIHLAEPEGRIPEGVLLGIITCLVMCPMMSMVATLVFKHPTLTTILPIWVGTFVRNLPFALLWSLIVARPISQKVVEHI